MWVIRHGDCTVYLLGTYHVSKWPTPPWFTGRLERAFTQSQELWLETSGEEVGLGASGGARSIGHGSLSGLPPPTRVGQGDHFYFAPARPEADASPSLAAQLSAAEKARLVSVASSLSLSPSSVESMKPGAALIYLSAVQLLRSGYKPAFGVDAVLQQKAEARGELVRGLETDASQEKLFPWFFSDAGGDKLKQLRRYLNNYPRQLWNTDRKLREWFAGHLIGTTTENTATANSAPEIYALLIAARNVNFAHQIEARLKTSGVVFVAVGVAHLVGPDSVVDLLRRDAIAVKRY